MIGLLLLLAAIAADSEAELVRRDGDPGFYRPWRGHGRCAIGSYEGHLIWLVVERSNPGGSQYQLNLEWYWPSDHRTISLPLLFRDGVYSPSSRTTAHRWMRKLSSDPVAVQQLRAMIVIYTETLNIPDDHDWTKIPVIEALEANQSPDWRPDVPIPEDADALG